MAYVHQSSSSQASATTNKEGEALNAKRPVNSIAYAIPPKTVHIVLVRHGHYINAHAPHAPDAEQVLSQLGRQQAGYTGKYLERLHSRSRTRHAITVSHSNMARAVETATIIGHDLGQCALNATALLREGWPGRPYMTTSGTEDDASCNGSAAKRPCYASDVETRDLQRMELAFRRFLDSMNNDDEEDEDNGEDQFRILVCHANLIRFFICRAMGMSPIGLWGHFEINHCGVTRIDICHGRPLKIISINETGHLPHSLITSSEDHL